MVEVTERSRKAAKTKAVVPIVRSRSVLPAAAAAESEAAPSSLELINAMRRAQKKPATKNAATMSRSTVTSLKAWTDEMDAASRIS